MFANTSMDGIFAELFGDFDDDELDTDYWRSNFQKTL
jgi:hypothetical protein